MKRKLSAKEYTYVASMLFGLFFGAGVAARARWQTARVPCQI